MATMTKAKDSALANILKEEASNIKSLKQNDYIDGVLIAKVKRAAYFDLGQFGTGILFGAEYLGASDIVSIVAYASSQTP